MLGESCHVCRKGDNKEKVTYSNASKKTYIGYWTGRNREILKIEGKLSPEQFEIEKAWARGSPQARVGSSAVHYTQL